MSLKFFKKGNLWKKVATVLSLFAIASSPAQVEARSPQAKKPVSVRSSLKSSAKRAPSVTRARASKTAVRKVRASAAPLRKTRAAAPLRKTRAAAARVVKASPALPTSRVATRKVLRPSVAKTPIQARKKIGQTPHARRQGAKRIALLQEKIRQEQEALRVATAAQKATRIAAEQEAIRITTAQKATRIAAEQEAARIAAKQQFLVRELGPGTDSFRQIRDSRGAVPEDFRDYKYYDLGYVGHGRARTQQYDLGLPAAPVLHPYAPTQELAEKGASAPAYALNVRFPVYDPTFIPAALRQNLAGVNPENIELFTVFQDMPWYDDLRAGPADDALRDRERWLVGQARRPLQLKPQSWLNPNAPFEDAAAHLDEFNVSVGVFSRQRPEVRIQAQPENALVQNHPVSIHNAFDKTTRVVNNRQLVSSGNSLSIENLDLNTSQILYSLTKHKGRAAVVRHVLLNQADEREFEQILLRSNNLAAIKENVRRAAGRFANINVDELF